MTDNDDRAPPRRPSSVRNAGVDSNEPPPQGAARAPRRNVDSSHVAPTDPEVPTAKRRGALRRQRSFIGLTAVVVSLLSIAVSLLYRASRQVGSVGSGVDTSQTSSAPRPDVFPPPTVESSERTDPAQPLRKNGTESEDVLEERSSNDNSEAGGGATEPKAPPRARDIIRTPAF